MLIFDIQRNSIVDGPGIRTTVFFKGCNLRCAWCHNPESQSREPELLNGNICGRKMTADEILKEILKDKAFYAASGGGVTFSGGECMLYPEKLRKILILCRKNGIHTAIDTAGLVSWESFLRVIPYTDMILYDIKCADDALHKKFTGASNRVIIQNLRRLSAKFQGELVIRVPVIGGFNDSEAEMKKISKLISGIKYSRIELLPYHKLGEDKYHALGREVISFTLPDDNKIKSF